MAGGSKKILCIEDDREAAALYAAPSGRGNSSRSQAPISHAARPCCGEDSCIGSREIGMLAACGFAELPVVRRPRVAMLPTGDELAPPGSPLRPAAVYVSNGAIIAAAVREAGGEAVGYGDCADNEVEFGVAVRRALAECDIVVISGGTSKGSAVCLIEFCHGSGCREF